MPAGGTMHGIQSDPEKEPCSSDADREQRYTDAARRKEKFLKTVDFSGGIGYDSHKKIVKELRAETVLLRGWFGSFAFERRIHETSCEICNTP